MKEIIVVNEYFGDTINSIITFNYDFEYCVEIVYHFVFTENNRDRKGFCCIGQWNVKHKTI